MCEQLEQQHIPYQFLSNGDICSRKEGFGRKHFGALMTDLGRSKLISYTSLDALVGRCVRERKKNRSFIIVSPPLSEEDRASLNPLKRAFGKKKSPAERAQERTELQPPLTEEKKKRSLFGRKKTAPVRNVYQREPEGNDYSDAQSLDWIPKQDPTAAINADQTGERPDVYFSTLKPDILVHEYHDRFELFRVEGNKLVSIGTEFK